MKRDMTTQIIVVEKFDELAFDGVPCEVVDVDDYLTSKNYFELKNVQVINLCNNYRYSSVGYYCSLLAEARRHRVIPSVKSMLDLSEKAMYSLDAVNLDIEVAKAFKKFESKELVCTLTVIFGYCDDLHFSALARRIFETFALPVLQVSFEYFDLWRITVIQPVPINRLDNEGKRVFNLSLKNYLQRRWRKPKPKSHSRYDLAILHDPNDPLPPSNSKALNALVKAGKKLGIDVDLIEKRDYARLAEYDALFIRDTTRINHYTYRFAKKAESEGMVVIDDPTSILRCTNKVYLAELLRANKVPIPKSVIVGRHDLEETEQAIGYPMVLKVPDGAFSLGVFKVDDRAALISISERLFKNSELILAQEYLYTEYDWRIGVLNRKPIYACQYFMAKKHWQIVKHGEGGGFKEGSAKTWAVAEVPKIVVDVAVKAAGLIGDGLYGVDVKQSGKKVYVIEVNDNPNLDMGVEDRYLGKDLYDLIMADFLRRLESRK